MSFIFGDSFDFYAAIADVTAGYWDGGVTTAMSLGTGRFTGSKCLTFANATTNVFKNSGSNDATHHIVCGFQSTGSSSSSVAGFFSLGDGATAQCSIGFRSDGTIELRSGGPTGTVLATYASALNPNVWTAFEFEVTINNTTGSFTARKNGNTSNDFSATSLNTRGGTANNYANRLTVGMQNLAVNHSFDDVLWFSTSGAAPNTWVGDVRAYQLMPTGDSSVQFAGAPNPSVVTPFAGGSSAVRSSGTAMYASFTAPCTGTIGSAVLTLTLGGTGNLKAAIFNATTSSVLGTSNVVVNPATGNNTITFGTPVSVVKGTTYTIGFDQDVSITYNVSAASNLGSQSTTAYASFPAAGPTLSSSQAPSCTVSVTPTVNATLVNEAQEDGVTSYVYDSTVGHADLYDVADLPANVSTVIAYTTRAFMCKSDAGARTGRIKLGGGDPSFSSVGLLCHADGTNGSTTFTDVSNSAHALTSFGGGATVTTTSPKFGTGSASIPGSTGISTPNSADFQFGSGQFTVECWGYTSSTQSAGGHYLVGRWGASNESWVLYTHTSGPYLAFSWSANGTVEIDLLASFAIPLNSWVHYAVDRDATNTIRVYANGVVLGSVVDATSFNVGTAALTIGSDNAFSNNWVGNIDDIRVTKGVARYAGAFTPPTAPFPGTLATINDLVLSSSFTWNYRTDTLDPNTSAAWSVANANAAQVGVTMQA